MWIATEINLHHDSTIKEAFNRQLAATQRKIFWDLNPDNPGSLIYQEYLNKYQRKEEKREMVGGYNYEHFTIFDNINIPQENREQFIAQYDPNSVWYKRDILGLRIPAEGLIYRIFSDNPERFIIEDADSYLAQSGQRAAMLMIGVDFGGNGSATTFKAVIITSRFKEVIVADEMYIKREINPEELNEQFSIFAQAITNRYGGAQVRADSAEQILIRGLKYKALKEKIRVDVKNSIKLEINNRIKLENMLMAQDRLKVAKKCTHMIEAFRFAVFDSKKIGKDERLDDGSSDIDSLDAFEYAIEPFYSELMKAGYTQKR